MNPDNLQFFRIPVSPKGWEQVLNEACSLLTHKGLSLCPTLEKADSATYFCFGEHESIRTRLQGSDMTEHFDSNVPLRVSSLLSSGWYLEWDKAFTISPLLDSSITHCTVTAVFVFKGPGTWWQGGYTWLLYLFTLCDFVFYHLYFSLTVFVCCVTRTYKVFTRRLWCRMTMMERFLQRCRGGKKEEKRNIFNNLPIVSLIQ